MKQGTGPTTRSQQRASDFSRVPRAMMLAGPPVLALLYLGLLWVSATSDWAIAFLQERQPVEVMAFACLFTAGILCLRWARQASRSGAPTWHRAFLVSFGIGVLFVAMEEISWGQWFLGFETPESWADINDQGETNLHNLHGIQGHSEYMHLFFGLGGLVGVALASRPAWRAIAVPPILISLLACIVLIGAVDLYTDLVDVGRRFDTTMRWMSEIAELYVAFTALGYAYLGRRAVA